MGRPPKSAGLPAERIAQIQTTLTTLRGDGLPSDPALLERAVKALTERIRKFGTADEYHHVRSQLAAVTMWAALTDADGPRAERDEAIDDAFRKLAYAPSERVGHNQAGLSIQREQVIEYLTRENMPEGDGERCQAWIRQRWDHIIDFLTATPCRCGPYETSYEAFLVKIERHYQPRTVAKAADLILSTLHDTLDPESVRKNARIPS
jgi:hypothetical protein